MRMLSVDVRTTMSVLLLILTSTLLPRTDGAAWNSWFGSDTNGAYTASEEAVSLQKLENYWLDAMDVVTELASYETLWIKPHSCVWSECAVDDTDDGYMGDNRDGDEQWYQYRTQGFCANAGYSLYGRKHHDISWMPGVFQGRCNRHHYINSFFTYGGADNLLSALGVTPVVYYDNNENENNNNNNNNNDDDGNGIQISANAMCYEVDQYNVVDDYFMTQYQNQNNEDGDNDDDQSNSGSQEDYDGYTETLGCGPSGEYIVGAFQSGSCDGNYFAGVVDPFDDYNTQHNALGCHPLYAKDDTVLSVENVYMLLNNSWSCDLRLYPDGCPDPYQLKEQYDFAMRTVIHGGNAQRAYRTMTIQKPLHIATYILLGVTGAIIILAYLIKNEQRVVAQHKGGRKSIGGYAQCVGEDLVYQGRRCAVALAVVWRAFVGWFRVTVLQKERYTTDEGTTPIATTTPTPTLAAETKKNKKDKKKEKKKRKSKSGKTKTSEETTTTSDDSYGQPNMYVTDITDTKTHPTTTGSDYVRQEDDDIEAVADIDRNGMVSLTRSKSGFEVGTGMATTTKKS